jgi:hypothetical protein
MSENRRASDKWFCKRLYEAATPWLQVGGFIILCGFTVGTYFNKFQALATTIDSHETRIEKVETEFTQISQKLDDIKAYMEKK